MSEGFFKFKRSENQIKYQCFNLYLKLFRLSELGVQDSKNIMLDMYAAVK